MDMAFAARGGRRAAVIGLLAATLGACGRPAASGTGAFGDGRLTLSGSSTVAPLVGEIAKRFEAAHPGVRIDVQTGGSLRGQYTVVIVTHNLAQARRIADDVAVFWVQDGVGTLIEHGPAAMTFTAPAHELTAAYVRGMRG